MASKALQKELLHARVAEEARKLLNTYPPTTQFLNKSGSLRDALDALEEFYGPKS